MRQQTDLRRSSSAFVLALKHREQPVAAAACEVVLIDNESLPAYFSSTLMPSASTVMSPIS